MLTDKVIVVTGASKGLGLATVKALLSRGAKVALLARGQKGLDRVINELKSADTTNNDRILAIATDVSDRAAVFNAFKQIQEHFGRLDGLVNNAGLAKPNKIEDIPEAELTLQVGTNFLGTVYCCQAAIPLLRKTGGGLIVNISSASVRNIHEMAQISIYAATKAAVDNFSLNLREELIRDNIGVTVVSPGASNTEFGFHWDMDKITQAMKAWREKGPWCEGTMDASCVGEAIAHCFTYPPGVTVDFMEVKPHQLTEKPVF